MMALNTTAGKPLSRANSWEAAPHEKAKPQINSRR
jgi:hypothetical protein